ncbi:MAG: acetyltransferase [Planctomycetaceae bacterium]
MSSPKLVIWGAAGHARVAADIVQMTKEYAVVGFLDDLHPDRKGQMFAGATILGGAEVLPGLRAQHVDCLFIAVGDCAARLRLADTGLAHGFAFPVLVHPRATVAADVNVGPGALFAAGSIVNANTSIGSHVIINTGATVDHDCRIARGVHIGPGAHLGGHVTVEEETFVGMGTVIRDHVAIGRRTVIGAGSLVLHDLGDDVVAFGSPARIARPRGDAATSGDER